MTKNKAYIVLNKKLQCVSVVAAPSRGQAIGSQYTAASKTYPDVKWVDFKAKRATLFDEIAENTQRSGVTLGSAALLFSPTSEVDRFSFGCLEDDRRTVGEIYESATMAVIA